MSIFTSPKFDPLGNSNQVGATNMNKMSVAQDAATLRAGVGTRMQYTPSGMVISTIKKRKASAPVHPFKVDKTKDPEKDPDTDLDIGKGLMITHRTNGTGDLSEPISLVAYFLEYDGLTTVTATGEGYVYLLCDIELVIVGDDTLPSSIQLFSEREVFAGTPSIIYSEDAPADYDPQNEGTPRNFAIPLAFVEMNEGIASVETQFVKWDIPPIGGSATYEVTP
jgi:hypothetical protein